jgi:excisionase family DNA binding protein
MPQTEGEHAMSDHPIPENPDPRLTTDQAAREANVGLHTIRRAYMNGHLTVQRFGRGRGIRIKRSELLKWIDAGGRTDERPLPVTAGVRAVRR